MKNLRMSKMVPLVALSLAILMVGLVLRKEKPAAVTIADKPAPVQVVQVRPEPEVIAAPIISVPEVPVQAPVAVETALATETNAPKEFSFRVHPQFSATAPGTNSLGKVARPSVGQSVQK